MSYWNEVEVVLAAFGGQYAATLAAASICAYLGLFLVMRRIVFTGVALAQLAAAGVGAAFFLGDSPWVRERLPALAAAARSWGAPLGSLIFSLLGALGLQVRPQRHRSTPDAVVGLVYSGAAALAILAVWGSARGPAELRNILAGDVLLATGTELFLLWFGAIAVAILHMIYRRPFLLVSFDPEFARVLGLPERRYQLLLLGSLAIAVALALRVMGLLVVFAYLVVPPLVGLGLGRKLGESTRLAIASGLGGTLLGFAAAVAFDLPHGSTITAALIAIWGLGRGLAALPGGRLLAGLLVQGLAILALVVGIRIFPWTGEDTLAVAPGGDAHGHGGAAVPGRSGPSSAELAAKARAELAGAPDPVARKTAAETLGAHPEAASLMPLAAALGDEDEGVREAALRALRRVAVSYRGLEMLQRVALESTDPEQSWQAARAGFRLGDPGAVGSLVRLLGVEDLAPFTREEVVELLRPVAGGEDFGFDPFAEEAELESALRAWQAWWRGAREGGLRWDPEERSFLPAEEAGAGD